MRTKSDCKIYYKTYNHTYLFYQNAMKKPLLSIAIIAISLSCVTFAENYTDELKSAYNYAHTIGITTQSTIDDANMYGSLLRSHMAKMMVNYAKTVLGKTADTSLTCKFSDIGDQSAELQWYIKQACQMWLMGQWITTFNPTGTVTRAQFGTVLSRALYGDVYNDGNPYYIFHLQSLQEAGIMTNISNPSVLEIRWYVMLMMMRASSSAQSSEDNTSKCDSSDIQLLCMIGSSDCPSECQSTDTTNAGILQVSKTSINVGTLPSDTEYVGSIKLTATDSDITLKTLNLQKTWTFTRGRIEDDGVKIWNIQTTSTDTLTTVSFSPGITIQQGISKILSIFIENTSATDQGVNISNAQSIVSTANSVGGSFPIKLVK